MRGTSASVNPSDLSKVKCPVLQILGGNDQYMGAEQGKLIHEAIVGSKLVILPTGHASAVELPGRFNAVVLEFLAAVKRE